ncbi:tight adherence protein B [Micromonospora echinospora]|uniref:Tight adherence protein B n=1 Tax=Micromonospora echinospora TaxID=1877 RepID=A0ABR6M7E3_MICEC|nr:hypothetical protein [Micromonospora echinospora]MBB5111147.1 tight adherence protein B [Micromonospora echinospora]
MTARLGLVALLLAVAAAAVAWPVRAGRARQLAVLGGGSAQRGRGPRRPLDAGPQSSGRPPGHAREPRRPGPGHGPATLAVDGDRSAGPPAPPLFALRRALPVAALLGAVTGALLGGPVGALALATYGLLAARAVLRRRTHRAAALAHRRDLDRVAAVAADLRAGLPADLDDGPGRVARLARAAGKLADRTGAPLADLLERIEADARAADRGLAAAAAQAAGARATAWLLAALPLGGIGLGYGIGVDPVAVLLHTPVGGGSALAAVALQVGGLLWAERLGVTPGRAA